MKVNRSIITEYLFIALLVSFILLLIFSNNGLGNTTIQNNSAVFSISSPNSTTYLVRLVLANATCGFKINGNYVSKLPYNFTVVKSYFQQNHFYKYYFKYDNYSTYVTFAAQSPYLRCLTAIAIKGSLYYLYPYMLNKSEVKIQN